MLYSQSLSDRYPSNKPTVFTSNAYFLNDFTLPTGYGLSRTNKAELKDRLKAAVFCDASVMLIIFFALYEINLIQIKDLLHRQNGRLKSLMIMYY